MAGVVERRRMARAGFPALSVVEGLAAFEAALGVDRAVVVPVKLDVGVLRRRLPVAPVLRSLVRVSGRRVAAEGAALVDRVRGLSAGEQADVVLPVVRAQVAEVLGHAGVDAVGVGQPFTELGFDSLTAVELRNRLAVVTGLKLPATL
ncbi:acyl carrier protein, partial [Actinoplanes sp. DH11]|uniref:acyl carrier protein n=1 Tax=Actinoplanes sp. DH11 TaxID=2857011 RepID=UPI001E50A66A